MKTTENQPWDSIYFPNSLNTIPINELRQWTRYNMIIFMKMVDGQRMFLRDKLWNILQGRFLSRRGILYGRGVDGLERRVLREGWLVMVAGEGTQREQRRGRDSFSTCGIAGVHLGI